MKQSRWCVCGLVANSQIILLSYFYDHDKHAWPDKTTPLLWNTWSMALSAMTVKCEWFIYLFIYDYDYNRPLSSRWVSFP